MYKAIAKRTVETEKGLRVDVDFVYGAKVISEHCYPQDRDGFDFWLKSRLETHNSGLTIKDELVDGEEIVIPTEETPTPPVLTKDEIDRNTWLEKYYKWVRIKNTIVDTGIVPLSNPKLSAMLDDLKATLKAEYIDYI